MRFLREEKMIEKVFSCPSCISGYEGGVQRKEPPQATEGPNQPRAKQFPDLTIFSQGLWIVKDDFCDLEKRTSKVLQRVAHP